MKHLNAVESLNNIEIFISISKIDLNKVKELIKSGIDIESIYKGNTSLCFATFCGRIEMVKELIKAGANVNAKNVNGNTALILSTSRYILPIIKELIESGADLNIKNNNDNDFLDYLSNDQKQEIIKKFPKQYKEYLTKKEAEKYNI